MALCLREFADNVTAWPAWSCSQSTLDSGEHRAPYLLTPIRKAVRILGYHDIHCPGSAKERQLSIRFVWCHNEVYLGLAQCLHQSSRVHQPRPNVGRCSVGRTTTHGKERLFLKSIRRCSNSFRQTPADSHAVALQQPGHVVGDLGSARQNDTEYLFFRVRLQSAIPARCHLRVVRWRS